VSPSVPGAAAGAAADTDARLAELLSRVARRLHRGVGEQLAPLGITWAQARVMRLIAEPGSSLRMADIAARLGVVPRSATSMVDALEEAALVTRQPDPQDRRSVLVSLTAEGRRLLDGLDAARRRTAAAMFGHLGDADRRELVRLLSALPGADGGCATARTRP